MSCLVDVRTVPEAICAQLHVYPQIAGEYPIWALTRLDLELGRPPVEWWGLPASGWRGLPGWWQVPRSCRQYPCPAPRLAVTARIGCHSPRLARTGSKASSAAPSSLASEPSDDVMIR